MAAKRSRTSSVWTYMEKSSPTEVVCLLCRSLFAYNSGTTTLWRHLRAKHPQEHEELEAEAEAKRPVTIVRVKHLHDYDELEKDVADTIKHGSFVPPVASTSVATPTVQPTAPETRNENTVMVKQDPDKSCERKDVIDRLLCEMIAHDLQSMSIVEDKGFNKLMTAMNPEYSLPNRTHIARLLLPELYAEHRGLVQKALEETSGIAITTDIWTSCNTVVFLTVTAHYINKQWEQKCTVLETCRLRTNFTGLHIATELNRIFKAWKVDGKISCIITDNGESIVEAVTFLNLPHMPCFAHTLNLVVQDSLQKVKPVTAVIQKVTEIACYFHNNAEAADRLSDLQVMHGQTLLELTYDPNMYWISTYNMFSGIVGLHSFVSDALDSSGKHDLSINQTELELIKGCLRVLEPFHLASLELSADKFTSIAKALPLARNILDCLTLDLGSPLCEQLAQQMKEHFHGLEDKFISGAATLLDPRFKRIAFAGSKYENIEKKLIGMMAVDEQYPQVSPEYQQMTTTAQSSLWSLFDKKIQEARCAPMVPATEQAIEFHRYYAEIPIQRQENPLTWWKARNSITPQLCALARRFLAIPATSIPAERLLAKTGDLISHRRSCIPESHVDMILFLNESLA